jgi:hypothetical protein
MIALFFFFLMHRGETESIKTVMLHQEWSTLGLLFGMMVIVGELSHTGVFEWLAVRLLVQSKGSFNRLMVLLCLLTAVASAFLDNVTTMLLLAPVTIDMCGILNVDPRPFLISEVILSNIGGTVSESQHSFFYFQNVQFRLNTHERKPLHFINHERLHKSETLPILLSELRSMKLDLLTSSSISCRPFSSSLFRFH